MKRFFDADSGHAGRSIPDDLTAPAEGPSPIAAVVAPAEQAPADRDSGWPAVARIAVYDDLRSAPRVQDVEASDANGFIENLASRTYELALDRGGSIPYTVIREVVENLIHAHFAEVVVSILDHGHTVRFADHGPGIEDKERSFAPGFSTATNEMKRVIRGVGSGLPIIKEYLSFSGGYVTVEDNLDGGTVVTLRLDEAPASDAAASADETESALPPGALSDRQKRVLSLSMELGSVGPSAVSRELEIALSTAYRDLAYLEESGLLRSDASGKRSLTDEGVSYLDALFAT